MSIERLASSEIQSKHNPASRKNIRVSLTLVFYYQVPGELELNYNCMICFDCESSSGYPPKAALKLSLDTLGVTWNAPGLGTL